MPGLLDLFNYSSPYDRTGQTQAPLSFADALASRQNSLIGLGLGLMSGGADPFGTALRGYQAGASADQAAAYRQAQLRQNEIERQDKLRQQQQAQANWERSFARGNETDYAKMQRDIEQYGDPARQYYASKLGEGPPAIQKAYNPQTGEEESVTWNRQTRRYEPFQFPGQAAAAAASAAPPAASAFDTGGTAGVYGYGPSGFQMPGATPTAPTTAAAPQGPTELPPRVGPKAFEPEQKLRKEFQDATKTYSEVRQSYNRVLASRDDAAGDLALIYGYMKMLDPGSVVRETEFATAQNAAGIPDQIRNLWNRLRAGERLNPQQREQYKSQAGAIYDRYETDFNTLGQQYGEIARQYRIDPARVVPRLERPAAAAAAAPFQQSSRQQPSRQQAIEAEMRRRGLLR